MWKHQRLCFDFKMFLGKCSYTQYLYTVSIHSIYTQYLYTVSIHSIYTQYLYGRSPDLNIVVTGKNTDFSVCLIGTYLFVNFSHLTISNLFELIQVLLF